MYVDMKKQCHEIMFYDATCFYVENNRNCSGVFETLKKKYHWININLGMQHKLSLYYINPKQIQSGTFD